MTTTTGRMGFNRGSRAGSAGPQVNRGSRAGFNRGRSRGGFVHGVQSGAALQFGGFVRGFDRGPRFGRTMGSIGVVVFGNERTASSASPGRVLS